MFYRQLRKKAAVEIAEGGVWYRLSPVGDPFGLSCDERGVFLGSVPLLTRVSDAKGGNRLVARPASDLNIAFRVFYGLPVDLTVKCGSLSTIANALNRGDVALAKIASVQMQLPDLPRVAKGMRSHSDDAALAVLLESSGILRGEWNPDDHPRMGTPPNPGWFAPVPKEPKPPAKGRYSTTVGRAIRVFIRKYAARVGFGAIGGPITEGITAFLNAFSPTELNQGEDRALAEMHAYLDPPKTLEELQRSPGGPGYDEHHIVLQHDANIRKRKEFVKFGREKIDDPSNLVQIPRIKHEEVNAYYEAKSACNPAMTRREWISQFDYETQYRYGLDVLRKFGILK
jgi:hypothetical protein